MEITEFNFDDPIMDPSELYYKLRDAMVERKTYSVSAVDLGIPVRAFVMGNHFKPDDILAVFNPRLVDTLDETVYLEEGSYPNPGLFISIKRPAKIKVRYCGVDNNMSTILFEGLTARIFLHELDTLDGFDYRLRATRYHRDKANKDKKLADRKKNRGVANR